MWSLKNVLTILYILVIGSLSSEASVRRYRFVVKETWYKRLCEGKKILTVNGKFPGPTIKVHKGDTIVVDVYNRGKHNISIHWHGVKQPRNPWADGPEYITQCPIQPGSKFSQKVIFSMEEGTLWWHAHSDWSRATVHGAIIIYPKHGTSYPFRKPHAEVPIILGEWWKDNVTRVLEEFLENGGQPRDSDAYTINGQPGDLYPCSKRGVNFSFSVKSLNSKYHPASVPLDVSTRLVSTVSVNTFPCTRRNSTCEGPNGTRLAASMNNISFVNPSIDILEAYYYRISGVYGRGFPSFPPLEFNYTADFLPLELEIPKKGTQVKVLKYNSSVEMVLQGTNLVAGIDHPMHLHGFSFYVVGWGFGNFDEDKDPLNYNLVDPPLRNTIAVPINGWTAIRFKANNPGVWFMHCHFERHLTWGMETVFIVRNGKRPEERLLPPPPDMPPC